MNDYSRNDLMAFKRSQLKQMKRSDYVHRIALLSRYPKTPELREHLNAIHRGIMDRKYK